MTIEFVVDSLDKVEESMRGVYVEVDGKFNLDVDKYADFKAQGLKSKNRELLGKLTGLKDLQTKADKIKDLSDEELEEALELYAQRDTSNNTDKKDAETIAKELHERMLDKERKKLGKTIAELSAEKENLSKQVREFSIWNPVGDAAVKAGVLPDRQAAFMKVLRVDGRFDLNEKGKVFFKDAEGDETDLSIDKAFESLKHEFPWAFKASDIGGSGADNNHSASGDKTTIKRGDFDKLSPKAKADFMKRDGARVVD